MDVRINYAGDNHAGYPRLDYVRPDLVGSEKQVAWATDIRSRRERDVLEMIQTVTGQFPLVIAKDGKAREDEALAPIRKALATDPGGPKRQTLSEWLDGLFAQTDSKFWIDNRFGDVRLMIAEAHGEAVA